MRMMVSLGGSVFGSDRSTIDLSAQHRVVASVAEKLAPALDGNEVVFTYGTGPEVGVLLLAAASLLPEAYPPDALDVEIAALVGHILQSELGRLQERDVVTLLTRTIVDPSDRAFAWPTRRIGPVFEDIQIAQQLAFERGWVLVHDQGGVRRVVAEPEPVSIVEADLIDRLLDDNVVVVCAGGGGVPVTDDGAWVHGVEAVVDRDLASATLAIELDADRFVCLTDVDAVMEQWGTEEANRIGHTHPSDLRIRDFDPGSIGPKVDAACRFVERTGRTAAIGSHADAVAVVTGDAGTQVDLGVPRGVVRGHAGVVVPAMPAFD